jgi:hypothetical protein
MYQITVEGIAELQQTFVHLSRGLNQAVAKGINTTAARVVTAEQDAMKTHIDRPTPLTLKSLGVMKASPAHRVPAALVFIKPIAAKYLERTIEGGTYEGLMPGTIKLNQYGNIPKRKGAPVGMAKLITRKTQFVGKIKTSRGQTIFGLFDRGPYKKVPKPHRRSHPAKARPVKPISVVVFASTSGNVAIMPWYRVAAKTVEQNLGIDITDMMWDLVQPAMRAHLGY